MAEYYKHSNTIPLTGVITSGISGVGTAVSVGVLYSLAIVWIPIVYVNFMLTALFGFLIGFFTAKAAQAGHVRNSYVPALIAMICALFGLYAAWAADYAFRGVVGGLESQFEGLHPLNLLGYMSWCYENGTWSIGRGGGQANAVKGIMLGIVWLVEAGVIIGVAGFTAYDRLDGAIYCEDCGTWNVARNDVQKLDLLKGEVIPGQLTADDFSLLASIPRCPAGETSYIALHLQTCPACHSNHHVSVESIVTTKDKKGNDSTKRNTLLNKLYVPDDLVALIENAGYDAPVPVETTAGGDDDELLATVDEKPAR